MPDLSAPSAKVLAVPPPTAGLDELAILDGSWSRLTTRQLAFTPADREREARTCLELLERIIALKKQELGRGEVRIERTLTELMKRRHALISMLLRENPQNAALASRKSAAAMNLGEAEEFVRHNIAIAAPKQQRPDVETRLEIVDLERRNRSIGVLSLLDYLLRGRALGLIPRRPLAILATTPATNPYLLNLLGQRLEVVRDPVIADELRRLGPDYESDVSGVQRLRGRWVFWAEAMAVVYREWHALELPCLLDIPSEHEAQGLATLAAMGLGETDWFACLHVRERGFKGESPIDGPHNCAVRSYVPAVEEITRRGGWVVRLGDSSMTPLPAIPHVVDYALGEWKSPFMDVFLISRCRFFIGTSSGPSIVAHAFDRPALMTNLQPMIARPPHGFDLFMPKLCRQTATGRLLRFEEVLGSALGYSFNNGQLFADAGVDIVDNDENEISAAVTEMLDRVEMGGTPGARSALQERFDALCRGPLSYGTESRMAQRFATKYASLF